MAIYFNIIVPFKTFVCELNDLMDKFNVYLYVERWNDNKKFYYEQIKFGDDSYFISDSEYRAFFFSSKCVAVDNGKLDSGNKSTKVTEYQTKSFYDDDLCHYCIEGTGGREDNQNIEIIRLRIISKKPDKIIEKFYLALQKSFKNNNDIGRGLYLGNYFDNKVYFFDTLKNKLADFNNKESKYFKEKEA